MGSNLKGLGTLHLKFLTIPAEEPISCSSDAPSMGSDQEPLKHPNQNLIGLLSNLAIQEFGIRLEMLPILNQYKKPQLEF
jgi:hypothetical protein